MKNSLQKMSTWLTTGRNINQIFSLPLKKEKKCKGIVAAVPLASQLPLIPLVFSLTCIFSIFFFFSIIG
jgi:hypothetical protein